MEVEIGGLQTWPDGKELEAVLAPFAAAANRKLPTDVLISEDQSAESRCCDAWTAVQVGAAT